MFLAICGVLGVLLIGVISPGPSFVLVARTSMNVSRSDGLAAAIGMGVGGVIFASLVLFGLQAILAGIPLLYVAIKILGGCYLLYMAVGMWRGASQPMTMTAGPLASRSIVRSFLKGMFTQLSNPKTAVVYGSIFAALLPRELPLIIALTLPLMVFVLEAGWYSIVAFALSSASSRSFYLRLKAPIDRVAASIIGLLGIKLISAARHA